jgi:phage tail sheath protein FI
MPQYLSPGVYVEEVPGTPPIVGVGTSTTGFIGVVNPGPTPAPGPTIAPGSSPFEMPLLPGSNTERYTLAPENEPRLVTNWTQFINQFGDFHEANKVLAHAVYGFLNNGGTRCWVVRITNIDDATAVGAALQKFEAIDEIAIVAVPGALDAAVQLKVIEHCENMKDRFAIIDGQVTTSIDVASIQGAVRDSNYAALYFPRIQVFDPVVGGLSFVSPSGLMAGVYSRVDSVRGVHKAPANEIVQGALGLEYLVTKNEQDGLNPDGINVFRNFNGNVKVWGARTLGGDDNGEFKYINVRRLMNFLRESIDEGTQFVVFEPNAPALWQQIIRSVGAFLTNVWRDGALFGNTPEDAFYVKCDESTNPPEVRELGQVVTEIGVAIVKPAEFVIFRITQLTGSAA